MDVQEDLLQRFAKTIDLPAFAWQQGFRLANAEPGSLAMQHPTTGERLLVERDVERGWTYRTEDDPTQRGSIVDFLARREGATRAACLERLAACADERGTRSQEAARYRAVLRERPEDLQRACREHEAAKAAEHAAARMLERLGVPHGSIDQSRFGPAKREADVIALTGEPEGLWASRYRPGDRAVVLVERPIDAIAYERANGRQEVCYVATGSRPDDERRKRLGHILAEVPDGVGVVAAFGRDQAGRRLAEEIQGLAPMVRMERQPPQFGARWADQMQLESRHAMSLQRVHRGPSR
jgi:hypothetical protein